MTATWSPRSFICRSASRASSPDSARTLLFRSAYRLRRSRATARDTLGTSSTVTSTGRSSASPAGRVMFPMVSGTWLGIPPVASDYGAGRSPGLTGPGPRGRTDSAGTGRNRPFTHGFCCWLIPGLIPVRADDVQQRLARAEADELGGDHAVGPVPG